MYNQEFQKLLDKWKCAMSRFDNSITGMETDLATEELRLINEEIKILRKRKDMFGSTVDIEDEDIEEEESRILNILADISNWFDEKFKGVKAQ